MNEDDISQFANYILSDLRSEQKNIEEAIVGGRFGDYVSYRSAVSKREGIASAIDIVRNALRNVETE